MPWQQKGTAVDRKKEILKQREVSPPFLHKPQLES